MAIRGKERASVLIVDRLEQLGTRLSEGPTAVGRAKQEQRWLAVATSLQSAAAMRFRPVVPGISGGAVDGSAKASGSGRVFSPSVPAEAPAGDARARH
jgi:hypothetical protein